ncbi:MAG: PEP-CTERM sorting domain-containing protein [Roseibium album]|uniref:PEP-CTERM sorting domain-containing protein n=1 Tax=Roseibium album TaxID=311410 RepID=UPI0032EBB5FA
MLKSTPRILGILALVLSAPAFASLIVQKHDGANPNPLHGYLMVPVAPPTGSTADRIALSDPLVGSILIQTDGGASLPMAVVDAYDAGWWQFDHGNVYATQVPWIELLMPHDVRAISFHVGASMAGRAWVEAVSGTGERTARTYFPVGPGQTQGVSVHSADACGSVSRVIIEPWMWGFGNVAVEQGGCTQVPEPGTLVLLAGGLLALGLLRARRSDARYTAPKPEAQSVSNPYAAPRASSQPSVLNR